jgi:hypothetical protein
LNKFSRDSTPNKPNKPVNIDPRSDLSDEDSMMEELVQTVKKMTKSELESIQQLKSTLRKDVENSIEEILEETEG